jgi:hypothetical protein
LAATRSAAWAGIPGSADNPSATLHSACNINRQRIIGIPILSPTPDIPDRKRSGPIRNHRAYFSLFRNAKLRSLVPEQPQFLIFRSYFL